MNAKWGNEVSLICGDFIYAKAFSVLSALGDPKINEMFSGCALKICEGEIKQVETRSAEKVDEEAYLSMIYNKTAALFETACSSGGYVAALDLPQLEALANYGKNLGMAFQMVDDCLDLVGEEEVLGKSTGSDFAKNDPTLPLIYLAQAESSKSGEAVEQLRQGQRTGLKLEELKSQALSSGAIEKSIQLARQYAGLAAQSLQNFPESPYRKSLLDLVNYTVQRVA